MHYEYNHFTRNEIVALTIATITAPYSNVAKAKYSK